MKRAPWIGWVLWLAAAVVPSQADCPDGPVGPDPRAEARFASLKVVKAYLQKRPEADDNGDGRLTPTEVFYVRSTSGIDSAAGREALELLRAAYRPVPIDESRIYGPSEGKKIKLFILSGQSNMAGAGLSSELPQETVLGCDRLLMFHNGKWQPLRPLHPTFGPEIAFGYAMAKAWPDETVGIVKLARGGTGILAWRPQWTRDRADLTGDGPKGNLWKKLTDKVKAARASANCEVMGFIWQQGGKDMIKLEIGKQYLDNLKALTEGLRRETGVTDLPLVLGSYRLPDIPDDLSDFDPSSYGAIMGRPGAAYVLKAQFDAQAALSPARMIPLRGLPTHKRNVHYDTRGQLMLGNLLANGYLELVK